jgi:two-component system OmpR family response regulator
MRILLIEDEEDFALFVKKGLESKGFAVDVAITGEQGLQKTRINAYDAILLDMSLPGDLQGPDVAGEIRSRHRSLPILGLTGKNAYLELAIKVEMLDLCDDYIAKTPAFSIQELAARIRAVLRRGEVLYDPILKVDDLILDPRGCTVMRAGKPVKLPPRQFALLEYFMRNAGKVGFQALSPENVR